MLNGQPCLKEHRMGKRHSFIPQPVFRQLHSLFQSEFSKECDLVLPLSISSTVCLPCGRPVAAYVFFLVFPSFISFNNVVYVLRNIWTILLASFFILCRMVVSSFTLCNTSFFTRSIQPNFSVLVQQHISKLLRFLVQSPKGQSFSNIQSYAPNVTFHEFLPSIEVQSAGNGSLLPADCRFCHGNTQNIPRYIVTWVLIYSNG
jgi:hypothetical protein